MPAASAYDFLNPLFNNFCRLRRHQSSKPEENNLLRFRHKADQAQQEYQQPPEQLFDLSAPSLWPLLVVLGFFRAEIWGERHTRQRTLSSGTLRKDYRESFSFLELFAAGDPWVPLSLYFLGDASPNRRSALAMENLRPKAI